MRFAIAALCLFFLELFAAVVPNDPLFSYDLARRLPYSDTPGVYVRDEYQWSYQNTGENTRAYLYNGTVLPQYDEPVGTSDIDACAGWEWGTDARGCRIGLLDLGVDFTHPDLTNNISAVVTFGSPHTPNSHATGVASIICAEGNNGIGMAGVCWRADLVCFDFGYREPKLIAALDAAITNQCRVLCLTWGTAVDFPGLRDAFQRVSDAGMLVVCSTLNDPSDMDNHAPDYPTSWGLSNVVVVTSSTRDGQIYSWAARGSNSVHLAAPGRLIPVCAPMGSYGGNYHYASGTSEAAPLVAGAVALYWASHPEATAAQVKHALLATVAKSPTFSATISGGMLNLNRLLQSPKPPTLRITGIIQ
jgi:subtilisin family serine protease